MLKSMIFGEDKGNSTDRSYKSPIICVFIKANYNNKSVRNVSEIYNINFVKKAGLHRTTIYES